MTERPPRRIPRDAAIVVGLVWLVWGFGVLGLYQIRPMVDALAYHRIDAVHPYTGVLGDHGAFVYPPPAGLFFAAVGRIVPEPAFLVAWTAAGAVAAYWLLRPAPWVALALAAPLFDHVVVGQVELFLAVAIALSFRWPALWAVPLLIKPTAGVGVLWFVVRGEWRRAAVAVGAAVMLAAASLVIVPGWWVEWFAFLGDTGARQGVALRGLAAAVLVVWGARTDRRWTVAVASCLALPIVYPHSFVLLAAAVRLRPDPGSGPATPSGGREHPA